MEYSMVFSAALVVLALGACDRPTVVTPVAVVAVPAPIPGSAGPSTDPSVPAAMSVSAGGSPASVQGKANPLAAMTKPEESMAMPKPGQANDHSSPALHPPK